MLFSKNFINMKLTFGFFSAIKSPRALNRHYAPWTSEVGILKFLTSISLEREEISLVFSVLNFHYDSGITVSYPHVSNN